MNIKKKTKDGGGRTASPEWTHATLSEFDGVRFLHLDSIWVQGAMRIRKPQVL